MAAVLRPTTRDTGDGFERGRKLGANSVLQGPVLKDLIWELSFLRKLTPLLIEVINRQKREIDSLRDWRGDCEMFHGHLKQEGKW